MKIIEMRKKYLKKNFKNFLELYKLIVKGKRT